MNCIICGINSGKIRFYGTRNNMTVGFCGDHLDDCKDCDVCTVQFEMRK